MTEDWLAAWDLATEHDRRLVLATVSARIAALADEASTYRRLIVAPRTFVIAARWVDSALVVATCSHFRDSIDDATRGIPVSPTDYHYVHVEIDELVVEAGRVVRHETLFSDEIFHLEPGPGEPYPPDDVPEVRDVADEFLITYPALSHVRIETQRECDATALGSWCAKSPQISLLAAVPDGARTLVTIVATYVIWHSTQSAEWGVQYVTIEEVALERGAVVGQTQRVTQHIDISPSELQSHDDTAATRAVIASFLAECPDWRVVWYAADARDRAAAHAHALSMAMSAYGQEVRSQMAENWHDPDPEVIAACRLGKRLIAAFASTYWVGNLETGSEQTFVIHQVTVEKGVVVRDRRLATGVLALAVPREQHDVMTAYRERLPGLRDRAAAIAHLAARLDRICDAATWPQYVIRDVTVHDIHVHGRVFTVLGWYRLGAKEQVGSDRITRYIEVKNLTVEEAVVVDEQVVLRTSGEMDEIQSDDPELATQLDNEHVRDVILKVREDKYRG